MGLTLSNTVNGVFHPASYHVVDRVMIFDDFVSVSVSIYASRDAYTNKEPALILRMPLRVDEDEVLTYFSDDVLLEEGHSPKERAQAWLLTHTRYATAIAD